MASATNQGSTEAMALWIRVPGSNSTNIEDLSWMHQMQRAAPNAESNQAFMAKVIEGLALAKAESDKYLTPIVEMRKQQLGQNNSNQAAAKSTAAAGQAGQAQQDAGMSIDQ